MLLISTIIHTVVGLMIALPLLNYRLKISQWNKLTLDYPQSTNKSELVIMLPIWNESLVIEKKLNNLISDYPFQVSLMVVDSASNDSSLSIVNSWAQQHQDKFNNIDVIEMPKRLGKTAAVKLAVETLNEANYDGLVLMTDADALLDQTAITRLHGWFADDAIGVVGCSANRITSLAGESQYRGLYEKLRVGESKKDSTPFLEGSCMMWRHGLFNCQELNVNSNADDAQIANLIRMGGYRSIFDNSVQFTDFAPIEVDDQRRQKIRRAQGLQHFLMNINPRDDRIKRSNYSYIIKRQKYFHLIIPVLLMAISLNSVIRWSYISITGMPQDEFAYVHALFSLVEVFMLVSWLTFRAGISLPIIGGIGNMLTSFEYLLIARYRIFRGLQSNLWEQHEAPRIQMSKFSN